MALVWQALRVVASASAQAIRRERLGMDAGNDLDSGKGSGMVDSTYIKWQLVNEQEARDEQVAILMIVG